MMKHSFATSLGIATLLGVPAVALRGQEPVDLRERLAATITAIADLAGIQERIETGAPGAVDAIVTSTEDPILAPRERDEFLAQLRREVSGLQMRYDELATVPLVAGTRPLISTGAQSGAQNGSGVATTGLDERTRNALAGVPRPLKHVDPESARRGNPARDLEEEGFSVDAIRQGKLMALDKRFAEAVQLLGPHIAEPEAKYWIARCFTELDRRAEAISILEKLVADEKAGVFAARAKYDLDFLRLEHELDQRRTSRGGGK